MVYTIFINVSNFVGPLLWIRWGVLTFPFCSTMADRPPFNPSRSYNPSVNEGRPLFDAAMDDQSREEARRRRDAASAAAANRRHRYDDDDDEEDDDDMGYDDDDDDEEYANVGFLPTTREGKLICTIALILLVVLVSVVALAIVLSNRDNNPTTQIIAPTSSNNTRPPNFPPAATPRPTTRFTQRPSSSNDGTYKCASRKRTRKLICHGMYLSHSCACVCVFCFCVSCPTNQQQQQQQPAVVRRVHHRFLRHVVPLVHRPVQSPSVHPLVIVRLGSSWYPMP